MRASGPMAPSVRAAPISSAVGCSHPSATRGTTTAGLNTPKAAATTSPGTCPSTDPRLQK